MTSGQARVLGLLILLMLLEAGSQSGVRSFFKTIYTNLKSGLGYS